MTATDVTTASRSAGAQGHDAGALTGADAVAGWLTTTDHTKVGRLYAGFSLAQVLGALGIAVVLGAERADATGAKLVDLGSVPQLFAAYRWTLVVGGVLPLLLGLGIAVVPHLVGADTIAFPRAAAASCWGWLLGSGTMIAASISNGGPGGRHPDAVQLWNVGLILAAASLTVGAGCIATTVVTLRRPGLRLDHVNPFVWAMFVVSSVLLLALPVLIGITVLVFADFRFADQAFGGAAELDRYVGWLTGQPQVLLLGLPALAVLADVMGASATKGRNLRLGAMGAIGLLSFGPWVQDAFTPKVLNQGWFGVVAILAPIAVLAVLGSTAARPTSAASGPLAIGGTLLVTLGAVLGVLRPWTTLELRGTVFGDGYTALVALGALLGLLAALVHWGPMLWGSGPVAAPKAMGLGLLGTLGGFLAGAPLIVTGLQKQPTNAVNFDEKSATKALNIVSTIGFALVLLTVLGAVGLFATSFRTRRTAAE
jgi:heme/copper-type cytochrome/quinol oxidase subunit 1